MPGAVFPADAPRTTKSHGERALWRALKSQLPDGWRAWHSLRLRVGNAWEGEGDFVIADPGRGLLVLEVKGGMMTLSGGRWLQNGKALKRPPRDQAQTFARRLKEAIEARGVPCPPFGVACVFPDTDFSVGPQSGDLAGLVIGRRQMPYLEEALPSVLDRAAPDWRMPEDRKWLAAIHALWGETWVPTVGAADAADDAAARRIALDEAQLQILDFAEGASRALVTGSAGSGKTIVARELCRRRAEKGQRVQFFCFTDALAKSVGAQLSAAPGASAAPIRRYAARLLRGAGGRAETDDPGFWQSVSFEAAASALPGDDDRPDLLVVDEAQDLEESDWALVEELSAGRDLWVFCDMAQRFWTSRDIPNSVRAGMANLSLLRQYRSPRPVWEMASAYAGGSASAGGAAGDMADGPPVRVVTCKTAKLETRLAHEITELLRAGARPRDIAVLTLAGQTVSDVWGNERLGSHRVCHADQDGAADQIICDTFLRFKGLERPYVILTEIGSGHSSKYKTRMHIACSRATVGLTVVCSEEAAAEDEVLRALRSGESA